MPSKLVLPLSPFGDDSYPELPRDASKPTGRLEALVALAQHHGKALSRGRQDSWGSWASCFVDEQSKAYFGNIRRRLFWQIGLELEFLCQQESARILEQEKSPSAAPSEHPRAESSRSSLLSIELTQTLTMLIRAGQQANDFAGHAGTFKKALSEAAEQMGCYLVALNASEALSTLLFPSTSSAVTYKQWLLTRGARVVVQEALRQSVLEESDLSMCLKQLWVKESESLLRMAQEKIENKQLAKAFSATLLDHVLADRYNPKELKNWRSAPKAAATLVQKIKSMEGAVSQDLIDRYSQLAVASNEKEADALKTIDFLLAQGLFVANPPATQNGTLLMVAIRKGRAQLARRLLDLGADWAARDQEGVSALDCAQSLKHLKGREEEELYKVFEPLLLAQKERQDIDQSLVEDQQEQLMAMGRACQAWLATQSLFDAQGRVVSKEDLLSATFAQKNANTNSNDRPTVAKKRGHRL